MNNTKTQERILLFLTFLLCAAFFTNLWWLKEPRDTGALFMALVFCVLVSYAYFVVRKFFSDGDRFILIFSCILSLIGIVMLYRLEHAVAIKQIIWFILGVASYIVIVVLLPDLRSFSKYKYLYLGGTIVFMAMATFFGTETYGAKNWIIIGPISFQPSEFGKLFLTAYLAAALKDYDNFKKLIEPAVVVMISLGFMMLQRDLGSALIFFGISVTMLYIATSKIKYVGVSFILSGIGAVASYKLFYHIRKRVLIWQEPWKYANNESFQIVQGFFAMASGGLFGTGLGLGHPEFVPVVKTDFIFTAICEELGILTGFAIIIIYFLLFYRCMRAAIFVEDKFSQLLAVGYSAMIASQVLVIIGGVMNMIPLTGITLPMISYGGTSMLTTFFALGIIQKISEEG